MAYNPRQHLVKGHRFFARTAAPKAGAKEGHLYVYDVIGDGWFGGVSAKQVADALDDMGEVKTLHIYINSPGGSVFEANAIFENIRRHSARKVVHVDGLAASAASVLAMVGDEVITSSGAMWMIHDPWSIAIGNKADMLAAAEMLDKVRGTLVDRYAARTKQPKDTISKWMEDETWMSAAEAKERGFTDSITEEEGVEEEDDDANGTLAFLDNYKKTPDALRAKARDTRTLLARMEMSLAKRGIRAEDPDEDEEDDEDVEDKGDCPDCKDAAVKGCGCCASCHGSAAKAKKCDCSSKDKKPCGSCCAGCKTEHKAKSKTSRASPAGKDPGQPGKK
jgi:ATP-dependent Clp protease protease subunit